MNKQYFAQEVVSDDDYENSGEIDDVLFPLQAMIEQFLDANPDTRWINVGFSEDGVTTRNITIGRK